MADENEVELDVNSADLLKPVLEKLAEAPDAVALVTKLLSVAQKSVGANKALKAQLGTKDVQINEIKTNKNVVPRSDYNTLEAQVLELTKKFDEQLRLTTEEKQKTHNEKLQSTVVSVAAAQNAEKPLQVFHLMKAEGLVQLKEDGSPTYIKKAGGKDYTVDAEEAIMEYLNANLHLKKGSGAGGAGDKKTATTFFQGGEVFKRNLEADDRFLRSFGPKKE